VANANTTDYELFYIDWLFIHMTH